METRGELARLIRAASVRIGHDAIEWVRRHLSLGEVVYGTDGGIFVDAFVEESFRTLADDRVNRESLRIYNRFRIKVRRLVG